MEVLLVPARGAEHRFTYGEICWWLDEHLVPINLHTISSLGNAELPEIGDADLVDRNEETWLRIRIPEDLALLFKLRWGGV